MLRMRVVVDLIAIGLCAIAVRLFCTQPAAADPPAFLGKVVVEWLDDDPFVFRMRLLEDFAFRDPAGRQWTAQKGQIVDGRSIPALFRDRIGPPFGNDYRRTSVLYDAYCQTISAPWRDVQRMFYAASQSEGAPPAEAKVMYMILYAGGPRWEQRDSSCYRSCHNGAPALSWMPVVDETQLHALTAWIRRADPALDQIDRRVDAAIVKPGPHIFAQGYSRLPTRDGGLTAEPQRKE